MSENVKVEYDGAYPTACMGTLKIYENGILIYNRKQVCKSSGFVGYDDEGNKYVGSGVLTWYEDEAIKFNNYIKLAVNDELKGVEVCCGGCD